MTRPWPKCRNCNDDLPSEAEHGPPVCGTCLLTALTDLIAGVEIGSRRYIEYGEGPLVMALIAARDIARPR